MAAHADWRLRFAVGGGGNFDYMALGSVDFRDSDGDTLCVGGTAYSSSHYAFYTPDRAFPGGAGDWITNDERYGWIAYRFTDPVDPAAIWVAATGAGNIPIMLACEWSDDAGTTWTFDHWMSKPDDWTFGTPVEYPFPPVPSLKTAQYWLMVVTASGGGCAVAEMRFLGASGSPLTGYTDPQGSPSGSGWDLAWDSDPATNQYGGSTPPFCHITYPGAVAAYGLSIQAPQGGFETQYTPTEGGIYSSDNGLSWGHVWDFSAANATGLPITPGGLVRYNTLIPPPPSPRRRNGPLIG